jgi:rod shape-determining protein MreC
MRIRSFFFVRRHHRLILVIALLITALALMSLRAKQRSGVDFLDGLWLELCSPFHEVSTGLAKNLQGLFHLPFQSSRLGEENIELRQQVARLKEENSRLKEAALASERLRRLLEFKETVRISMVGAEVIGRDPSSWFKSVTINKGEKDGVRKGMAVTSPEGVVGQVLRTGPHYSVVLLITDYNSALDGLIQRTRGRTIVEGRGENRCQLKYLLRTEDVVVGDIVITSGLTGNFPKGLVIGEIRRVEKEGQGVFQEAELVPCADLSKLEEVLVITETRVLPSPSVEAKEAKPKKPAPIRRKGR